MRGEKIYSTLTTSPLNTQAKSRGRSDKLIHKRNERLCARLYWLKRTLKWDYATVLEQLQLEFDLSTVTITEITQQDEWQRELRKLHDINPKVEHFKKKWPWVQW